MLLFPYYLQNRNTRADKLYYLIPRNKTKAYKKATPSRSKKSYQYKDVDEDDFEYVRIDRKMSDNDVFSGTF